MALPTPEQKAIMTFLHDKVFDPILTSSHASTKLRRGVNSTIMHMSILPAESMVVYYWNAIVGTDKSTRFAQMMKAEQFTRFEDPDVIDEFRSRFNPLLAPSRRKLRGK